MSDIFLSYKREDKQRAKIIAEALELYGFSVWWDRIIPPGKTWDNVIEEELRNAKCVLVIWSKESVKSEWVSNEASDGYRRHILTPVLIDNVEIPLEFKRLQASNLINWDGTLPNPEFDLLVKSIGKILYSDAIDVMKKDIFLSYKSEDRERAIIIAQALEKQGLSVFWDRNILGGQKYRKIIGENLKAARCMIVLWSNDSVDADFVIDEATEGLQREILIPVLIDDVEQPLGFGQIQYRNLINWQGELPNPEFDLLLESIGQILGKQIITRMEDKKPIINEVNISEERLEEKKLPAKISPRLKWGSMIVSLVLMFIFWAVSSAIQLNIIECRGYSNECEGWVLLKFLLLFGFPAAGYLMYKERKTKINYGLVWILVPILTLIIGLDKNDEPNGLIILFFILAFPAIIIDIVYIYKKPVAIALGYLAKAIS
jgi:hypothetical protein